jgi:hypothetical protein
MSESATFTQSSSPTSGLTAYSVERRVRDLYPQAWMRIQGKLRRPVATRSHQHGGTMKKDHDMNEIIERMVGALSTSMSSIAQSNADNKADLIKRDMEQFTEALRTEITGELAKAADAGALNQIEGEILFKGIGTVGRIANMLSSIASSVENIKRGVDYKGQTEGDGDKPSEELDEMLDHLVLMGELILRAAVNEDVAPLMDHEDPDHLEDGVHVIMIPHPDHPDDEDHHLVVKTVLPGELAKFATHPEALVDMAADVGQFVLLKGGIDVEDLAKAAQAGDLAKAAAPQQNMPPAAGDQGAAGGGDPSDGTSAMPDDPSMNDPLTVLGRLAACMMVVIDHLQESVSGTDEPVDAGDQGQPDGSAGQQQQPTPGAGGVPQGSEDGTGKSAPDGDLAKVFSEQLQPLLSKIEQDGKDKLALQRAVVELSDKLEKLSAQPMPGGPARMDMPAMTKSADTGGQQAPDLSKLSPDEARLELMKLQLRRGKPHIGD